MPDKKLSKDEVDRINRAASRVESVSSGEVLTAVIQESSDYAFPELLFSLFGGFIYYIIVMFFHTGIERIIRQMFWNPYDWYVTAFYGATTLIVIGLLYIISNVPGFDRLIVPKAVMRRNVHRRALVHFIESGAVNTSDRTGILFFISMREKMVEIIADEGINSKVEQSVWDGVLAGILGAIRGGRAADGLEKAILECADILEQHFPVKNGDINELPDGLVYLQD